MTEASKNKKLLRPLIKGLPLVIIAVVACVLAATWYVRHTVPMYESTAKIKLADTHEGEASANLYKDFDVFANSNKIGTEVEMMKSKVMVGKTLDSIDMQTTVYRIGAVLKTELYRDAPFKAVLEIKDRSLYGKAFEVQVIDQNQFTITVPGSKPMNARFGQPILLPVVDINLELDQKLLARRPNLQLADQYEVVVNDREHTIDQIVRRLDVTAVDKEVPILRIIYQSPVPEKAADYVNVLANTYVNDYVENKYRAADITVQFLNGQLNEMGQKLVQSENTIESYRTDANIINIHQETETDLRKIAQLRIQLANLQMNLAAIDTLDEYVRNGEGDFLSLAPNFEAFTDLLSTEMIKKIKELQSEKKDLLVKFTEKDEQVQVVDEKIRDLTSYLAESIHNTKKNYEIKYREIENSIRESEKVFTGLPSREKNMTILERNFGLNEKIYNYLHQKRTEAEIARAATISFHRIMAKGEVPARPVSPNKVVIVAVSAILGLLISIVFLYTIHSVKAKVNDSETIEKNSDLPVVAEIPKHKKRQHCTKDFNAMALQLELRRIVSYPSAVAISCFREKEGNSYITGNLAKSMIALGRKVLVVDVRGNLAKKHQWILSNANQHQIYATNHSNLSYYKVPEQQSAGLVKPEELHATLLQWNSLYDAILICNEPLANSSNALVYMSAASVNLFVLDACLTPAKKIMEANILQQTYQIPAMSFVLNRADYNPSLLLKSIEWLKRSFEQISNRKNAHELA